jgi:hypothetical protein
MSATLNANVFLDYFADLGSLRKKKRTAGGITYII